MIKIDLMINNLRFGQLNNWREYHSATHRSLHTDDLASLGNKTPHLHWHIIPRYEDDNHFPGAIWSAPKKNNSTEFNQKEERDFISKMKVFLSQ